MFTSDRTEPTRSNIFIVFSIDLTRFRSLIISLFYVNTGFTFVSVRENLRDSTEKRRCRDYWWPGLCSMTSSFAEIIFFRKIKEWKKKKLKNPENWIWCLHTDALDLNWIRMSEHEIWGRHSAVGRWERSKGRWSSWVKRREWSISH